MFKKIRFYVFLILTMSVQFFAFSEANLHNTVIDFNNNVIDFTETGLMDNIRGGELTNLSPLDLTVGSIFIDIDGIAKKVVAITQSGDEIFIDTVQPELREVFEFYDIPIQTINLNLDDHLVEESAPPGYNLVSDSRAKGSKTLEFPELKIGDDNASVSLGGSATLAVDVKAGARLPYTTIDTKGTWKFWKWKLKYYQGFVQGDINYDLNLEAHLKAEAKFSKELNIPIFALTTGPGIDVGVGMYAQSSIEGSITLSDTLEFNLKGNAGAKCLLDGFLIYCVPTSVKAYGSTEYFVKNTLKLEANVELKEKVYLGTWIKIFGYSILEADAGGGPYLNFNAYISGWVQYSSKSKFSSNWEYSGSGELGVFAEINASVFNKKWGGEIWAKKFPFYKMSLSGGGKSFAVAFDGDGATTEASPSTKKLLGADTKIDALPTEPKKNGYKFDGWFTEKNGGGTEFTADTEVTESITVYAKWTPAKTVTFDGDGATTEADPLIKTIAMTVTKIDSLPVAPQKTGYRFDGWFTEKNGGGKEFTADTEVTESITVYAKWVIDVGGIGPAGGYIFYDKGYYSDGWRYLECAPESTEWSDKSWSYYPYKVSQTGTAIGAGKNNTALIVAALKVPEPNVNEQEIDRAAQICDALSYGGYDDWFLPSIDELIQMYQNLKSKDVGGFGGGQYWSSSQLQDSDLVWFLSFYNGDKGNMSNSYKIFVRAVRAF